MSYIENNLMKDEEIIFQAKPHWIIFFKPVFWLFIAFLIITVFPSYFPISFQFLPGITLYTLITFIALIMAVITGLSAYIHYISLEFAVTNKRVIMKTGLVNLKTLEIMLPRIEGISVNQGIIGRLLNYGTLLVSGIGGSKDTFINFPDPLQLRNLIQEQAEVITT